MEWHKTSERLPESCENVLAVVRVKGETSVRIAWRDSKGYWFAGPDRLRDSKVTHWIGVNEIGLPEEG